MEPNSPPPLPTGHPASASGRCFSPWLFFSFLIAPGLVSIFTMLSTSGRNDYGMASFTVLSIGSVIAGFVCGIHFARIQTRLSAGAKIAVGVVSVIGCAGVAFALGFGGCYLLASVGILK
jgi:hypothetical protein